MIEREKLPEDAADWSDLDVSFEPLPDNTVGSCPESEDRIFEYVCQESADTDASERSRFRFIRTAQVGDAQFWLWEYEESDGMVVYVTFQARNDETSLLGLAESNGLSPEQFMLAEYYDEIYW